MQAGIDDGMSFGFMESGSSTCQARGLKDQGLKALDKKSHTLASAFLVYSFSPFHSVNKYMI